MTPAAPLRLHCALVVRGAFERVVLPAFRAATGRDVTVDWQPTSIIMARLEAGERPDAVLVLDEAMDRLVAQGVADPATRVGVARSRIGIAVRAGAPHPELGTVEALVRTLLAARSVCYSRAGASGLWFAPLLERLGIAPAVNARATIIPTGLTAAALVTGVADLAVQQVSELLAVDGLAVAGTLPDPVQQVTSFAAAMLCQAADPGGARRFLELLRGDAAVAAYRASGLEPLG